MKKILKLYKMLSKNSKGSEESSGSFSLESSTFLVLLVELFFGFGVGFLFWKNAELVDLLGGATIVLQLCGLTVSVGILFLGFLNLLNNMYMASDIEILITLPFSAEQIAVLRALSFLQKAYGAALCIMVGACIGLAMVVPVPVVGWIGVIVGIITIPMFILAIAAILVELLMSFVRALRSRETLRYIGMFLVFILLCVYLFFTGSGNLDAQAIMVQAVNMIGQFKYVVPVIGFSVTFIQTGNALYILFAVLATAAAVIVFFFVTKALYLKGAMNMMDAGGGKILTEAEFDKLCRKNSPLKSLMNKEFLMTRRNPAYLLGNYIIGLLWPILCVLLFKQALPIITDMTSGDDFAELTTFSMASFVLFSVILTMFTLVIVSFPMTYQSLAYSAISREGKSFMIMKQIPVSYADQLEAKRRMARNVAQFSVTVFTIVILLVVAFLLKISVVYCIIPIVITYFYTEFHVNLNMYEGVVSADVNWDNEKKVAEKGTVVTLVDMGLMFGFAAIGFGMVMGCMNEVLNLQACFAIIIALGVIFAVGAVVLKKRIMIDGEKKIRRMRF